MGWYPELEISGSGLLSQRIKLNTIAENVANAKTTRTPNGGPYVRKEVIFTPMDGYYRFKELPQLKLEINATHEKHFSEHLRRAEEMLKSGGVEAEVIEDNKTPFVKIYDPSHPDADATGYVKYPNVDITKEMVNLLVARRAYEANVSVIRATKEMFRRALEIGK